MSISIKDWTKYTATACCIYAALSTTAFAQNVAGKVTHSISVPNSGEVGVNSTISWSPLSNYNHLNFSYVKLGIQKPSGTWSYPNKSASGPYRFSPDIAGRWCFRVRGSHNGTFGNYTSAKCMTVTTPAPPPPPISESIRGKITHSISVPSSGIAGKNVTVSWSPLSSYDHLNFSYVKLGIQKPDGSWSYPNKSAAGPYNFVPDEIGNWCFRVRASYSGEFGHYSSTKCISVSDPVLGKVTHQVTSIGGDYEGREVKVSWRALPEFADINFSYEKIFVVQPDGSTFHTDISNVDYYEFVPTQVGNYCFRVRGKHISFSLYGNEVCHQIKDRNLLGDGSFDGASISPWNDHRTFHIGNWNIENGKLTLTSPILSERFEDPVDGYQSYQDFYDACLAGTANRSFRCRKSEISFSTSNYEDATSVSSGGTSIYAYEFKINKMFDPEDCSQNDSRRCFAFISQFHTGSALDHLSPNNSVQIQYDPSFSNIELSVRSKIDCENAVMKSQGICQSGLLGNSGERYAIAYYDTASTGNKPKLKEGETYYIRSEIKWSTDATGAIVTYLKGPGTGNVFVKIAERNGIQTIPKLTPVIPQIGLYWGGLKPSILYPKGDNDSPLSVTLDDIWMVREECHLPQVFRLNSTINQCH